MLYYISGYQAEQTYICGEVLKWSKRRDSKTNRPRHSLFPEPLAAPGFYGIEAQRMQAGSLQFSIKIPTIK